jgi:hypothetical protein
MAGVPHAPDAALCPDGHHRRRFRMDDNPDSDRRGTAQRVRDGGLRSLDCGAGRRADIDQIGRVNEGGYPIGGASVEEVAILLRISSGRRLPARVGDESLDDPGPDLTGVPQPLDGQPAGQLTCAPMRGPCRRSLTGHVCLVSTAVSPLPARTACDRCRRDTVPPDRSAIPGPAGHPQQETSGDRPARRYLTVSGRMERSAGAARPIPRCVKGTLVPSRDV